MSAHPGSEASPAVTSTAVTSTAVTSAAAAALGTLADPALDRLWARARARLERNGLSAKGSVRLEAMSTAERIAIRSLLGLSATPAGSVSLEALDERLCASPLGTGLLTTLEALGGPVLDRREATAAHRARAQGRLDTLRDALADHGLDPSDVAWVALWVERLRASGLLARAAHEDLAATAAILAAIDAGLTERRTVLASRLCGHAHGLDDDTWCAKALTKALAVRAQRPEPAGALERRALWDAAGVRFDDVSDTALVWDPTAPGWVGQRAASGMVAHLCWGDVSAQTWTPPPGLLVCENPAVVATAAQWRTPRPVLCASGSPSSLVLTLLDAAPHGSLGYHGDFDWPGLALAARFAARYGAHLERMGASDYRAAVARLDPRVRTALEGNPVDTPWDPRLRQAMVDLDVVVHEESPGVIEALLDITSGVSRS